MREDGLSFGLSVNRWFKLRTAYRKMVQVSTLQTIDGSFLELEENVTWSFVTRDFETRTIL